MVHIHRYVITFFFVIILSLCSSSIVHAVKIGTRLFSSDLANDIQYSEKYYGKVNILVIYSPELKESKEITKQFSKKYDTTIVWRLQPESNDFGMVIVDKSGYVRWKYLYQTLDFKAQDLLTELGKLKRSTPLSIDSPVPDFRLTDTDAKTEYALSDYRNKKNVLVNLLLQTY
ncbi:hypothetical protein C6497_12870 [Candidatus Poribacteria bacterium]|nr:MAG: hypothetical protein C6497_12870 [Candidatus Poribacteria bacterium]